MRLQPRDYQTFAKQSVFKYFEEGNQGNPIVAMPTGTGKSVVIADLLESILKQYPYQRILVLTHVKELIDQNYLKLISNWPEAPAGIYSAGLNRRDTMQSIIFGGIASVIQRKEAFGRFDLIFVDECHLVNPEDQGMYRTLFNYLRGLCPYLKIIGFTATPWKLGHGSIIEDGIFTDICCDMTGVEAFNWLIAQGYLMPLIPKKTHTMLDIEGVHKQGGEFIAKELQNAVDKESITRAALGETVDQCADRNHWLTFAAGVDHAIHIAEMLNDYFNIPAIAIHGKLSRTQRDEAIRDYKSGRYRVAVNNNVLTTGFDFPGIDLILMLRPTCSTILWVQMLGRGTRPDYAKGFDITTYEGRMAAIAAGTKQNCLVLDYAGNTRRLGPINDPVVPHKKGSKPGTAPVKECSHCDTWNHASARFCINCGAEFTFQTKLKAAASTEAIVKGDLPVVEVFKVDYVTYSEHVKGDRRMVKVSYSCGFKLFTEYVAIDHETQSMRTKARNWWKERAGAADVPETTAQLLEAAPDLPPPTHLRVWVNQKYPTVLAACFDGSAFGTQEPSSERPQVGRTVKPILAELPQAKPAPDYSDMDDDIPF